MKDKKILVTGADGFIGSHLVEHLVMQGYKVKAFALYNSFNSWGWLETLPRAILDNIEVVTGDVRDANGVRIAMKGCNAVLHLAALIAIPYSYTSPETYIDTNIKGTLNILQAGRDLGVEKIICTSTSEVYGTARFVPITEEHPLQGQSPYSASKIGADQIALSFYNSFETPVGILRPFNTYGPRQSARAVLPTIISQIATGVKEIKLGSLTPTRDYTFVQDTAKGFEMALNSKEIIGQVVNIGSNFEISIKQAVDIICHIMGKNVEIITDEARVRPANSEVERLFAGTEKAEKLFRWNPEHKGLEGFQKGMEKTIEWFLNPENLKHYKANLYNI